MLRTLLRYFIAEARLLWSGCALALFAFCWVRVWLVSFLDMTRFKAIVEQMPKRWERFSPVPFEQLFSYEGRIAMAYEEPIVYFIMAVWAVTRGSDSISGHLGKGTLELALSTPLSRTQWFSLHTLVSVVGAFLLAVVAWCGTWTGIASTSVKLDPHVIPPNMTWVLPSVPETTAAPAAGSRVPMHDLVDSRVFLIGARNYACLTLGLLGITTLCGCWDQYRWRTIGMASGFLVIQMTMELVGMAAEGWRWLRCGTIFGAYEPVALILGVHRAKLTPWQIWIPGESPTRWGPWGYDCILLGLGTICLVAAWQRFRTRDLPAPL